MTVPCGCCPIGQGCRLVPSPTPVFSGRLTNVAGNRTAGPGPNAFTFTNFAGSGVAVTVSTVGDVLAVAGGGQETDTLAIGVSPPADVQVNVSFSQPVYLRSLGMTDLDDGTEDAYNFQPQIGGVYGQKTFRAGPGCHVVTNFPAQNPQGMVHDTVNNGTGGMTWPGTLTSTLTFNYGRCGSGLGAFLTELAFDLMAPVYEAVFSCRMPDGDVRWYNAAGVLIPDSQVAPCPASGPLPGAPPLVGQVVLSGAAFGDAPGGNGENLCALTPTPDTTTGFAAPVGGCYNPVTGNVQMVWNSASSVELSYGNPPALSGGVIVAFNAPLASPITWPTNLTGMAIGEVRVSNPFGGGHYATLTYLSGPLPATGNAPRMEGGTNIGLHRATTEGTTTPVHFRVDFFQ